MTEARAMLSHAGMDREIPQTNLQPVLLHFVVSWNLVLECTSCTNEKLPIRSDRGDEADFVTFGTDSGEPRRVTF